MRAARITLAIAFLGAVSQAGAEEVSFSLGLRGWHNTWTGSSIARNADGSAVLPVQTTRFESDTKMTAMPFALVRYRDFGASASVFTGTEYPVPGEPSFTGTKRSEYDVNALYFFLPTSFVSVGYKKIKFDVHDSSGPTLAVSGSAPLAERWGLYGSIGYGWLKTNLFGQEFKTRLTAFELGVSYSLGAVMGKSTAVTVGYRHQNLDNRSVQVLDTRKDLPDTTKGPIVGFVMAF